MNIRRGWWLLLLGTAVLFNTQSYAQKGKDKDKDKDKGKDKDGKTELVWKAFDPSVHKKLYQELKTNTTQKMTVNDMEITQKQTQTFYVEWTPQKADNGSYVVKQKIIGVIMDIDIGGNKIQYNSLDTKKDKNPMTEFFDALKKMDLTLTIDKKTMEVTKIEGRDEFVNKLGEVHPQMEPLLKSILSEEALKKMAEPTWAAFPPEGKRTKGSTWEENTTLNLGPIGTYKTKYDYSLKNIDGKTAEIDVKADLTYSKPDNNKGLPFKIKSATLKSAKPGTGSATFDIEKGFITESSMKMTLAGDLEIEIGGMTTKVNLNQQQDAHVTTSTDNLLEAAKKKAKE